MERSLVFLQLYLEILCDFELNNNFILKQEKKSLNRRKNYNLVLTPWRKV